MVVNRLLANLLIHVGQRAKLVDLILEGIGVDRAQRDTVVLCVRLQGRIVVDFVPRNVQGNGRSELGVAVHGGRVLDLFKRVARGTCGGEHLESGPRVAKSPRRQFNCLGFENAELLGSEHKRLTEPSTVVEGRLPDMSRLDDARRDVIETIQ